MLSSFHTHTRWSDGASSIEEMIAGARAAGLDELGFSDHYVLTPDGVELPWSMPLAALGDYVRAVQAAQKCTESPVIRLGLEADFFPETIDELRGRLAEYPFDYLIGSIHIVDGFHVDEEAAYWEAISPDERDDVWRLYWARVREMAASGAFDIVGHLDLPKKFGFLPSIDLATEESAALDAIAAAGITIELNTAGWRKPINDPYPSARLLVEARRRNIPLIITADAHHAGELTAGYPQAREMARAAGYDDALMWRAAKGNAG